MRNPPLLAALAAGAFTLFAPIASRAQEAPLYQDSKAKLEDRVSDLFGLLTQKDKLSLLSGTAFTTQPIPHLGVSPMAMVDAGQGVRGGMESTLGPATAFPSGVAMASTWDGELIGRVAKAIGEEARNKGSGAQILLGPAVNIHRSPLGGRNGEYFSEDPFLTARLAVDYIKGMQSTGVAACLKHFACNNEEVDRDTVDVRVGERALREIYLPAFEAGVKEGGAWTVMSSYNKINGPHASANTYLLTDVLKKGWGFDGLVMSDWGGVHEVSVAQAGNDLEMPGPGVVEPGKVAALLERGAMTQPAIDDSVRRILRTVIRTGLLDGPAKLNPEIVNSTEHQKLAREAASKGIVLLKNQGPLLPLDRRQIKSIAVIGGAAQHLQIGAAGSPTVQPFYTVELLDGIRQLAGPDVTVRYSSGSKYGIPLAGEVVTPPNEKGVQGFQAEYFANPNLESTPVLTRVETRIQMDTTAAPAPGVPATNFSVRWTARLEPPVTGEYTFVFNGDDGYRVLLDGKPVIDSWKRGASGQQMQVSLQAHRSYDLTVEYFQLAGKSIATLDWELPQRAPFQDAIDAARRSSVAVVCVSTQGTEGEGNDRPSMALPGDQLDLLLAVAKANKRTVVVLNNGTPVEMKEWLRDVPAVLEAWFPGQEGGAAIAAILFGEVNPSGKLPDTFALNREDYPDAPNFPGTKGRVKYEEGIYVGYRHFDKAGLTPIFPFGHGLSYTTFAYGKPTLSQPALTPDGKVVVTIPITNTGSREGEEIVQLYVHDPKPRIDKPVRELKGFAKIALKPRETKPVTFTLTPRDFAYFDVPGAQWKADAGAYELEIGASSRDLRQKISLPLTATFTESVPLSKDQLAGIRPSLSAGRPVKASSVETSGYKPQEVVAENAVDENTDSRWSSQFADPQWLAVDLGQPTLIDSVHLLWQNASALAYSIEVSNDGKIWTTVFLTDQGAGGLEKIMFPAVKARWVRMFGTKRATNFGYSIFEFSVFGPEKKPASSLPAR